MYYIRSEKDFVIFIIKIVPHVLIMHLVIVNAHLDSFMIKTCYNREKKRKKNKKKNTKRRYHKNVDIKFNAHDA